MHTAAERLDARTDLEILTILRDGQAQAIDVLPTVFDAVVTGAHLMAQTIAEGRRLIYAAAGSSALMALADAAELGGTFGIDADQIRILMAGGLPIDARMPGGTEDDVEEATRAAQGIGAQDTVIALSASGTTPYPMTIARIARDRGANVICIANNEGAPIFDYAHVEICIPTQPEVIAGSTRMGAGSAQKATLNMMSTLMGVRLGHVYDGMMVNLIADNAKLRARAAATVAKIADVNAEAAQRALAQTQGTVKPAVLLAAGATLTEADHLLSETKGNLRAALARM
jgi:N-acetylmuramic acid 6-phosphate etherase